MGVEHGTDSRILRGFDVRKVDNLALPILGEAFDQILEGIGHRVPSGFGPLFPDDTLDVDESILPYGGHLNRLAVIGFAELPHQWTLSESVEDAAVADPPSNLSVLFDMFLDQYWFIENVDAE